MPTRQFICAILSTCFLLSFCSSETAQSVATDMEMTHYGGCIMLSRSATAPNNLYFNTGVVPTDEYPPFTKKITVYGFTLVGRDDITDEFMLGVAQTITEILPQGGSIDSGLQEEFISNMYEYRALIPLYKDRDRITDPEELAAWNVTRSQNSVCDVIMARDGRQVMEVIEHILHYANDVGLHYTFPDEWAVTTESQLYHFMLEAVEKGYYDISSYDRIEDEERRLRVSIQEFGYWIISTAWDLQEPFGSQGTEWTIRNGADLKEKMPRLYEVYDQTVLKIMVAPSRSLLSELFGM
jgi:hypothetical protein